MLSFHASKYIKNVSVALSSLGSEDVRYDFGPENVAMTKKGFVDYGKFPACLGAVDGT